MVSERGWSREDAESRIAAQASREDRLAVATHVIDNAGPLSELSDRVGALFVDLEALAAERRFGTGPDRR
jgi:dephospho-CoA kinase